MIFKKLCVVISFGGLLRAMEQDTQHILIRSDSKKKSFSFPFNTAISEKDTVTKLIFQTKQVINQIAEYDKFQAKNTDIVVRKIIVAMSNTYNFQDMGALKKMLPVVIKEKKQTIQQLKNKAQAMIFSDHFLPNDNISTLIEALNAQSKKFFEQSATQNPIQVFVKGWLDYVHVPTLSFFAEVDKIQTHASSYKTMADILAEELRDYEIGLAMLDVLEENLLC